MKNQPLLFCALSVPGIRACLDCPGRTQGPPFLQRVTMYSGTDVDLSRGGNLVRRVLGLPLSFGQWEGNSYLHSFDSQQMRFLQSNEHSALVIPPLSEGDSEIIVLVFCRRLGMLLHMLYWWCAITVCTDIRRNVRRFTLVICIQSANDFPFFARSALADRQRQAHAEAIYCGRTQHSDPMRGACECPIFEHECSGQSWYV